MNACGCTCCCVRSNGLRSASFPFDQFARLAAAAAAAALGRLGRMDEAEKLAHLRRINLEVGMTIAAGWVGLANLISLARSLARFLMQLAGVARR